MKKLPTYNVSALLYIFLGLSLAVQAASPAFAQTAPTPAPARARVAVDMVVTDAAGKPVSGLHPEDFTVLDNNQPQKVLAFHAMGELSPAGVANPNAATEVMILIDTLNAPDLDMSYGLQQFDLSYVRQEISKFLKQNKGQLNLPVSLYRFNEKGLTPIGPTSRDGNAIAAAMEKADLNSRPYRSVESQIGSDERLDISLHTLGSLAFDSAKRPGRKVVIWVSAGWPFLEFTDAETGAKEAKIIFSGDVTLTTVLRQARMTVYGIDPNRVPGMRADDWFRYTRYLKPLTRWQDAAFGNMSLQVLSVHSGGLAISDTSQLLSGLINTCIDQATPGYVASFEAPPATTKDEYHDLKVTVNKPGLKVRARSGYYGQP
jgi:VWFA-related protein